MRSSTHTYAMQSRIDAELHGGRRDRQDNQQIRENTQLDCVHVELRAPGSRANTFAVVASLRLHLCHSEIRTVPWCQANEDTKAYMDKAMLRSLSNVNRWSKISHAGTLSSASLADWSRGPGSRRVCCSFRSSRSSDFWHWLTIPCLRPWHYSAL